MNINVTIIITAIWIITVYIAVKRYFFIWKRNKKEKKEFTRKGYHRINSQETFQIAREFFLSEYSGLFDNAFNMRVLKGFWNPCFYPAEKVIEIRGIFKEREARYQFLITPVIKDEGGVTWMTGYTGHIIYMKYSQRKSFVISKTKTPICSDLYLLINGFVKYYSIVDMGSKLLYGKTFRQGLLRMEELKTILEETASLLGKYNGKDQIKEKSISDKFPEKFKVTDTQRGMVTRISGAEYGLVYMKLLLNQPPAL